VVVPGLRELGRRCRAAAELDADAAAERSDGPGALPAAFLRFVDEPSSGVSSERVDRLLGEPVSVRVSLQQVLPGIAATALLALLTAGVAFATACVDLDLLSALEHPELLTTGLAPLTLGVGIVIAAASAARAVRRHAVGLR
jgi:hypothetical protein